MSGELSKTDHDLLIELNVKQEFFMKSWLEIHATHVKEDAEAFQVISLKLDAAHRRIDELNALKNKFMGVVIVGSAVIPTIISVAGMVLKR